MFIFTFLIFNAAKVSIIFQSSKLFRVNYAESEGIFYRYVIRPVFGQDRDSPYEAIECDCYRRESINLR